MSENHIPFDFCDDSILANQGAGKTIEKPLKELPWNQQNLELTVCNTIRTSLLSKRLVFVKVRNLKFVTKSAKRMFPILEFNIDPFAFESGAKLFLESVARLSEHLTNFTRVTCKH